jgi:hypothetical protein
MLRNSNLISRDPRFATFSSFATNLPAVIVPYSQAFIRGPRP